MRRTVKARILSAAAATVLLGAVAFSAPAEAYVAGTATVSAITYNPTTGFMNWKCYFDHWAGAPKYWRCELWNYAREYTLQVHSGSNWTGVKLTVGSYSNRDNINEYAYRAVAGYNDGSGSASQWRWSIG